MTQYTMVSRCISKEEESQNYTTGWRNYGNSSLECWRVHTGWFPAHKGNCYCSSLRSTSNPNSLDLASSGYHPLVRTLKRFHEGSTMKTRHSSKRCIHGCKIMKWTSTAVAHLRLCSTGRNAWIVLGTSWNSDRTSPVTQEGTCFCTSTFASIQNKCIKLWYGLCIWKQIM
jgi:hypothetical protein